MGEVFAGFVCGFLLSLLSAPIAAGAMVRMRTTSPLMARMLPEGTNVVSISVVLQIGLFFFWTGFGIILGLLLLAMEGLGDSAPGIKNPPYTLLVLSFVLAIAGPFAILLTSWWREIVAGAVLSFLLFGILMPYMAEWSKFDRPADDAHRPYEPPTTASADGIRSQASATPTCSRCSASLQSQVSEFAYVFDS